MRPAPGLEAFDGFFIFKKYLFILILAASGLSFARSLLQCTGSVVVAHVLSSCGARA